MELMQDCLRKSSLLQLAKEAEYAKIGKIQLSLF